MMPSEMQMVLMESCQPFGLPPAHCGSRGERRVAATARMRVLRTRQAALPPGSNAPQPKAVAAAALFRLVQAPVSSRPAPLPPCSPRPRPPAHLVGVHALVSAAPLARSTPGLGDG